MSTIKIYHNPRCRKSREGLKHMEEKGIKPTVVNYMNSRLSVKEIAELIEFMKVKPFDLVRTQEELYKKELKGKSLSDKEWIEILSTHPQLIKRPIVVKGKKAVWGDPPTEIDNVL
jgi:arsenate reductase (glutaredoxin)